jgi:hypothetical protein
MEALLAGAGRRLDKRFLAVHRLSPFKMLLCGPLESIRSNGVLGG